MRKRIYIAGPISKGSLFDNLKQATEAFLILARAGFAPLCPHWSAYAGGPHGESMTTGKPFSYAHAGAGGLGHEDWMAIDLPWVSVADAVFRLPGESAGADEETALAHRLGIPTFQSITNLIEHFGGSVPEVQASRGVPPAREAA